MGNTKAGTLGARLSDDSFFAKGKVEQLLKCFYQGKCQNVIAHFNSLEYPERLYESERKMVEFARKRTGAS